jgi:hypothetical protein
MPTYDLFLMQLTLFKYGPPLYRSTGKMKPGYRKHFEKHIYIIQKVLFYRRPESQFENGKS